MKSHQSIGEKIRHVRLAHGWSVDDLKAKSGVETIEHIENGLHAPCSKNDNTSKNI